MSFRPYAIPQMGGAGFEDSTINPGNTVQVTLSDGRMRTGVLVKQEQGLVVLQCRGWFGAVDRVVLESSSVDLIRRLSR